MSRKRFVLLLAVAKLNLGIRAPRREISNSRFHTRQALEKVLLSEMRLSPVESPVSGTSYFDVLGNGSYVIFEALHFSSESDADAGLRELISLDAQMCADLGHYNCPQKGNHKQEGPLGH